MEKNQLFSDSNNKRASLVDDVNRILKLGLDVHYRQVTVAMQEDGGRIKVVGKMRSSTPARKKAIAQRAFSGFAFLLAQNLPRSGWRRA